MTSPREAAVPALYDDDMPSVRGIPADRITAAVARARDAFWESVRQSFPEVTGGDMAPGDDLPLEWGSNAAVVAWLTWNAPEPTS